MFFVWHRISDEGTILEMRTLSRLEIQFYMYLKMVHPSKQISLFVFQLDTLRLELFVHEQP